ncbi:MAG: hypothetical protein H7641_00160 [Candidatus Heimdallarchaeota archaeon]|nr:hypothetical protein [Candidatus Heimdallarchaeota archaeon]MCK4875977.1 hypothetical protein [Candidatus Heimdallarchaeota archaeon]
MKGKITVISVLTLLIFSSFLSGISISNASVAENNSSMLFEQNGDDAFEHIYGPPGHVGLAVSEEDNLIFTNAPEGLALIQRDDLSNQTVYTDEIGLTDVQIQNLEIDKDLKLLYIGSIQGVDILNYSQKPLSATPLLTGVATNFELGDFIDVDPLNHMVWIVTQSHGLYVYDAIKDKFADISGYNPPAASVKMLTVDVNSLEGFAFIGTSVGVYKIDTTSNTTEWFTTSQGLLHDYTKLVKYYPSLGMTFIVTYDEPTAICDGLSVLFENNTIMTFNYTQSPYYSRAILDLVCDPVNKLGFIVSPYTTNAESGLLVFNTTSLVAIAKSYYGSLPGGYPVSTVTGAPYPIESMLATIRLDSIDGKLIIGTVQRIQKMAYTPPTTAITENSPILGLAHNIATDVNYNPTDGYVYVSSLLGLDRVDPTDPNRLNPLSVEHLIEGIGGAGGDTAGELLVNAQKMYHHRYMYDIVTTTITNMESILPLGEYRYVRDISSSYNESLIYYCTAAQNAGIGGNGSLIIYNRDLGTYHVENFTTDKTLLEVNSVVQDPTRDVLYVGTNDYLILYNLTTLTEIVRYGGGLWDISSLEWINGLLWFGLDQYPNVRIFNPITVTFSNFGKASEILYPSINDIYYLDTEEEIYIVANSGLYVYNYTNGEMKYESETEGLSTLFVKRALYVPSTGEVWVGSFQGINIYDRTYDIIVPDIIADVGALTISGVRDIDVSASDYAGIKQLKLTLQNASWFDSWSTNSPVAIFSIVSTNYENGAYQIIINATDWNDNVAGLAYDITIDNVIINELSKLILLITIPIIAIPVILARKRRKA